MQMYSNPASSSHMAKLSWGTAQVELQATLRRRELYKNPDEGGFLMQRV